MFKIGMFILALGPVLAAFQVNWNQDWQHADRTSAEIAPLPSQCSEAIVQIYQARDYKWRGVLSVHTWIAVKSTFSRHYTVYQINGWQQFKNKRVLEIKNDLPDRLWYGNKPEILFEIRGKRAERVIKKIQALVANYPYKDEYEFFPGPNSNTFVAYLIRNIDQINCELPPTAIGKDYLPSGKIFAKAPSGSGFQLSFNGLFNLLLAKEEGMELSICGLVFGVNFSSKSVKLPGIGTLYLEQWFSTKQENLS